MEQQTVSISKAGITTTLNARSSILAAANPIYGKYNKSLTPHQNINLSTALLSRFDLIFLIIDKSDIKADELLAKHVTYVHQQSTHPETNEELFDANFMGAHISHTKIINTIIPKDLHSLMIKKYFEKRNMQNVSDKAGYMYVTTRTLLGKIRLSQALARLRFSELVIQSDIEEAIRLMDISRESIDEETTTKFGTKKIDKDSEIFYHIKEALKNKMERGQ